MANYQSTPILAKPTQPLLQVLGRLLQLGSLPTAPFGSTVAKLTETNVSQNKKPSLFTFLAYPAYLSDLWKLAVTNSTIQWTWMGGAPLVNQTSTNTFPGSKMSSVTWVNSDGNLVLFGGISYHIYTDYTNVGSTSDMYLFNTSSLLWHYLGGPTEIKPEFRYGNKVVRSRDICNG